MNKRPVPAVVARVQGLRQSGAAGPRGVVRSVRGGVKCRAIREKVSD